MIILCQLLYPMSFDFYEEKHLVVEWYKSNYTGTSNKEKASYLLERIGHDMSSICKRDTNNYDNKLNEEMSKIKKNNPTKWLYENSTWMITNNEMIKKYQTIADQLTGGIGTIHRIYRTTTITKN